MKTMTLSWLQFLSLNSRNERQKAALEAAVSAYQNPNGSNDQAVTKAA
jgi:hypothetical protein